MIGNLTAVTAVLGVLLALFGLLLQSRKDRRRQKLDEAKEGRREREELERKAQEWNEARNEDRSLGLQELKAALATVVDDNHTLREENANIRQHFLREIDSLGKRLGDLQTHVTGVENHVVRCESDNERLRARVAELERA